MIAATLVPDSFEVPQVVETDRFRVRLLDSSDLARDYDAYMTGIEHVRGTFDPADMSWPAENLSMRLALADLYYCEWEHHNRTSFSYGVFSLDGTVELGCIYLHPTWKADCEVQLQVWARQSELASGFEDELFAWARDWVARVWPFKAVACPGRLDSWEDCARPLFLPRDFTVPERVEVEGLPMRLMVMEDMVRDYDAYMGDIDHLRALFVPEGIDWPRADLTPQLALADLGWCEWEHFQRTSFSYCLLDSDERRQLGCLYVMPTDCPGFDAEVRLWTRAEEHRQGLDRRLAAFAKGWLATAWPFERVAFPGWEDA